jgi:hypothetical protein
MLLTRKALMAADSTLSVVTVLLVAARAVNILVSDRYSRYARRPSAEAAGECPLRLADRA